LFLRLLVDDLRGRLSVEGAPLPVAVLLYGGSRFCARSRTVSKSIAEIETVRKERSVFREITTLCDPHRADLVSSPKGRRSRGAHGAPYSKPKVRKLNDRSVGWHS
jgi:hypothetical protein